jgi:TP901 family phage tail tape measure protein
MAASEAEAVADKFARLAAVSATNFEEMANALSKVASQANMAGMSMDFTLGLLAKGIETTRESPESIGTALKTVIARMQELSDFGKTLEDGMDVNRVETMLGNLGIALRDSNGELRSLEDVIKELGGSWRDLTKNQKAGIAVALAGTRQQSRLIAMMDDFERTLELTNEAQESAGTLNAQHSVYVQGLEASINKLTNSYQEFVSSLADNQLLITLVNILR